MRKHLVESAKGADKHRIKVPTHNISLKNIKAPPDHLSKGKADTNHAVKETDFPQTPSRQLFETAKEKRNHKKVDDRDARLSKHVKEKGELVLHLRSDTKFDKMEVERKMVHFLESTY